MPRETKLTPEERFEAKILRTESCWLYTGGRSKNGYGVFSLDLRSVYAHRFAYELWVGPIPEGLCLDHLCRVRHCVNPKHLEPVTGRINILRGISEVAQNARRSHCVHGHPFAGANLRVEPSGRRRCRRCNARRQAQYAARVRERNQNV